MVQLKALPTSYLTAFFITKKDFVFLTTSEVLEKRIDRYSRNELVQILLHGEYPSDTGKYAHNKQLFSYVQKFLVSTKRLVYKSKLQYNPL